MSVIERYHDALRNIPPPGCSSHPYLLTVADYGVMSELSADRIFSDVRAAIPTGARRISDREITDTINKALADHKGGTFTPKARPTPVIRDGKKSLQKIIEQGKIATEVDLWEASPIRMMEAP